jgi:hypothetical protein
MKGLGSLIIEHLYTLIAKDQNKSEEHGSAESITTRSIRNLKSLDPVTKNIENKTKF